MDQGYYLKAQNAIESALVVLKQMGNRLNIAISKHGLGELACRLGNYEEAEELIQEALAQYRAAESTKLETLGLYWLGLTQFYQGEYEAARQSFERSAALAAGVRADKADAHYGMGMTLAALEQFDEAKAHLEKAVSLRNQVGYTALAVEATAVLAEIAYTQNKKAQAHEQVNNIIAYLDGGGNLNGTEAPFRVHLTCYQVLKLVNPTKAKQILNLAYQQLLIQADRFNDKQARKTYLSQVSWHKIIIDEWERLHINPNILPQGTPRY